MNTFGLTGMWSFDNKFNVNSQRIELIIDKQSLYFIDSRNFGTLIITDNIYILNTKLLSLGPDLLKDYYTLDSFTKKIKTVNKKKTPPILIKLLMDQTKKGIGSGLGNYLAVEILYNAKLSPHRLTSSLSKADITSLFNSIQYIIKLCYTNNKTGYMKYFNSTDIDNHKKGIVNGIYPNYLPNVNVGDKPFEFNVYMRKVDLLNNKVISEKIINERTTYWCPSVQK